MNKLTAQQVESLKTRAIDAGLLHLVQHYDNVDAATKEIMECSHEIYKQVTKLVRDCVLFGAIGGAALTIIVQKVMGL